MKMKMKKEHIYVALGILGIMSGLFLSGFLQQSEATYCESIEQKLHQNRSFNGSIGCYPPGVLDANVSERVRENAELKCVCRIIDRSGIRLFPVAVSN